MIQFFTRIIWNLNLIYVLFIFLSLLKILYDKTNFEFVFHHHIFRIESNVSTKFALAYAHLVNFEFDLAASGHLDCDFQRS